MKANHNWINIFSLFLTILLVACSGNAPAAPIPTAASISTAAPESTPAPQATPMPLLAPGEVTPPLRTLEDIDSSLRWYEKRVLSGDNFLENLYERPFTSKEMIYQPDINIIKASIASDDNFYYFILTMQGLDPTTNALTGTYAIEFDRTKTGRGDLLIRAHGLKEAWSVENVKVYVDLDKDIGGPNPGLANAGFEGNGYESEVKLEGDKVAYARKSSDNPKELQIAVSQMLLGDTKEFLWNIWADKGINEPGKYDYNDHFGQTQVGSPIKTSKNYPLAALYSVDNTCRLPFGFDPKDSIPGMCLSAQAKPCVRSCLFPVGAHPDDCITWSKCP